MKRDITSELSFITNSNEHHTTKTFQHSFGFLDTFRDVLDIGGDILGVGGDLFGKEQQVSGYQVPTAFEYELIDRITQSMQEIDAALPELEQLYNAYSQKADTLAASIDAQIPDNQVIESLRDSNVQIAKLLGADAETLAANGFITPEDAEDLKEFERLQDQDFKDPALEREIEEQKTRLMQELKRGGASPAVIAQEMNRFDQMTSEARFTRRNELRAAESGFLAQKMGLRQQSRQTGLNQVTGALQTNTGVLDRFSGLSMDRYNLEKDRLNTGTSYFNARQDLRDRAIGQIQTVGEFDLSGDVKGAINEGRIGPSQAGFSSFDQYKDFKRQEGRNTTMGGQALPDNYLSRVNPQHAKAYGEGKLKKKVDPFTARLYDEYNRQNRG